MKHELALSLWLVLVPGMAFAQPRILSQPTDQTANQGYGATFQLRASGTPPLSYAWFFNQTAIAGATTNKLIITNARPTNAGDYFAIVSDSTASITSRVAKLTVILPVALDPKIGLNIQMGEDPPQLAATNKAEAEIHLERSPLDAQLLMATFQQARQPEGGGLAMGYAISRDGGLTWERGLLPNLGPLFGGSGNVADSVAAFDLAGNAYINSLNGGTLLSISTNAAMSFAKPRIIPINGNADKNWLTINTYPNSPTVNRVAVTWTEFDSSYTSVVDLRSAFSDNGGTNWSRPISILTKAGQATGAQGTGTQPLFLPDGSLAVVFYDWSFDRIAIALSSDGGASYTTNRFGPKVVLYDEPRVRAHGIFPSATADRQAGIIYVTYQSWFGQGTNKHPAIMFTRSMNRGQTWTTPVAVNDTPNKGSVFTPAIAVSPDGQHVVIEFYDRRNDTGTGYLVDLYVAESFDGGETWGANLRVSEFTTDMRKAPLTTSGGGGYFYGDYQAIVPSLDLNTPAVAAWIDARSGSSDPFSAQIKRTRGATFETWRKLRWGTNDLANPAISGPAADPDGDGIPNLSEYALGVEPNHADTGVLHTDLIDTNTGRTLRVAFTHPTVLSDVQFDWEESSDLVEWRPAQRLSIPAPDGAHVFWATETAFFGAESTGNKFVRLVVKQRTQ